MTDGYEYQLFISYPRRRKIHRWVADVLQPELSENLEILGLGDMQIFRDERDITGGEPWPDRLAEALARSRVLLAVLSHPFWESGWCCSEWATARARAYPKVIVPLVFNDCEENTFKQMPAPWRHDVVTTTRATFSDFSEFAELRSPNESLLFRTRVREFAERDLKPAILGAPPWSPDWPRLPTDALWPPGIITPTLGGSHA